ncbi:MAG: shikimate dehydrogenase [Rhodospirillaceae bacterium]|mgnify:FL=1|jgi:shikimate dehydrogenase|nr:shikimate dehydrogenase [Rhodospirillaceae bacterium]MBT3886161.1 shikimate dehydrogenase [Rhodospirillaceae bacterium]MBT4118232.1 shikimate dehydrogenase [Rhodospirillaceae bacterium]MBT4673075.1 shikimate dehydrogenase [Rhodospirillaceae bacterium]MBT4721323.1 shikimate dehydrogenase [Rhodospirillaceae bacterium]
MSISGNARLAGVMGWPIAHSLSPRIHNYWLRELGIDGAYVPMAVAPENLADALRALPKLGFTGVNITIPHKQAALMALDHVDDLAMRIGAVNTVTVGSDGALTGTNTDGFGFIENLRDHAPGLDLASGPVVVLGAGGAARGIIAALMDAGAGEIRLLNRTRVRAEVLAADLGEIMQILDWDERAAALQGAGLLVNTTSLGMTGAGALDLSLDALPAAATVADAVYTPLETPLLAAARGRGNITAGGLGMLLHQARPGFAAWFGTEPQVTPELVAHILDS